ncbi:MULTISPECIES: DoxX family protein [unclassified Bradyrhizobium]|uniref:DoxX family protein n=1 Tax=unclassified Bradyrhizobium TaxID=2631580 RepID=UPI0020B2006E|nr:MULTISPECIES: DoxX family protein [unclassified Bradyrhizobium]MCP3379949.1 DoxX family protein [Bradyrhizobium sp. CCGUVB4N]MCP3440770.1 DoxX family protein [Bradyrhizobium sp. CCGUVB14]
MSEESVLNPGKMSLWVLRGLMGFVFIATGAMKLVATPMMIEDFNHLGLGLWFMYFTGALEVIGGVGVLVPRLSPWAALLLLVPIDIAAFVLQLMVFHHDWIHPIVFGLILFGIIYLQQSALRLKVT